MKKQLLCSFLLVILFAWAAAATEFVIVVNKDNSLTEISKTNLKRLFTGKKKEIGGVKVVPVNQSLDSDVAKAVLEKILKMDPEEYKEFWVAEQVKGGVSAPMIQKTNEAVIAIVSQLPGGIGYVEKEKVTDAVKVIPIK